MKQRLSIDYTHDGKVHVLLVLDGIHYGFHHEADDLKTALIQCYAKALNWMWMMKTK